MLNRLAGRTHQYAHPILTWRIFVKPISGPAIRLQKPFVVTISPGYYRGGSDADPEPVNAEPVTKRETAPGTLCQGQRTLRASSGVYTDILWGSGNSWET